MELLIEKLDNEGKGIGYIDNKIVFVPKTLPGDIAEVNIIKKNKRYDEARLIRIIKPSVKRIESKCKHFSECGGCNLLNLKYEDTIDYKKEKITDIFYRHLGLNIDPNTIYCENNFEYRNKIVLHIKDKQVGLISEDNDVFEIDDCLMGSNNINDAILFIKSLNINNGEIIIRENNLGELLLSINTLEEVNINSINKNIIGIIYNNKILHGKDYFIESINNLNFRVSYKSFFQINRSITCKLFELIENNIEKHDNVLDLYCGVGTLGIASSKKACKVIGIDNTESNIKDAKYNSKLNSIKNAEFILGDASIFKNYITSRVNTIIVDPPRNGLNKKTLKNIIEYMPNKLLYVSCNPFSLVRDLKELLNVCDIKNLYLLDMFPFTHHVETITILYKK